MAGWTSEGCVLTVLLTWCYLALTSVISAIEIELKAPVNPVDENGILSLYCQVSDMKFGHNVIILRSLESGVVERLSWGDALVADSEDDRIFLAVRNMADGSTVYFLSIMNVKKSDAGVYSCKVMTATLSELIVEESLKYDINYFPDDVFPMCSPKESVHVKVGETVTLNCTSGKAFPEVTLQWSRSSSNQAEDAVIFRHQDLSISSILTLRATPDDNDAIFLCTMKSRAFPDILQSCHIGPLVVSSNGTPFVRKPKVVSPTVITNIKTVPKVQETVSSDMSLICDEVCSSLPTSSTHFFWIIAAVTTSIVTIIFFVMLLCIVCQYKRNRDRLQVLSLKDPANDLYEQVDYRGLNRKVYMTLATRSIQDQGISCGGQSEP